MLQLCDIADAPLKRILARACRSFFSSLLLLSDTKVYEPHIRARLGTVQVLLNLPGPPEPSSATAVELEALESARVDAPKGPLFVKSRPPEVTFCKVTPRFVK